MTAGPSEFDIGAHIAQRITLRHLVEDKSFLESVRAVGRIMADALRMGHEQFFMGNGGSAADAQHLTAEFNGRYRRERRPLPAIAMGVNTSSLTAIANDHSFDVVFARQLDALGAEGDIAIGLSTSGNSANVPKAMEVARSKILVTVGITGRFGGPAQERG